MEFPRSRRELSKEEVQDAQIGLLEWELEERDERHGIDPLTGLKKREPFEKELDRVLGVIRARGEAKEYRAGSEPIREASLLFIDLDGFKGVNDTLGHLEGDAVLKKVAGILTDSVREEDTVGRFGGDEFYILLPRTGEKGATVVANKIRTNIESDSRLGGVGVTASIGVCPVDASNATDSKTLITHADEAALAAKRGGKNRVEVYSGI